MLWLPSRRIIRASLDPASAAPSITVPSGLVAYLPLDAANSDFTAHTTQDIIGARTANLVGANRPTSIAGQIAEGMALSTDNSTTTSVINLGSFQGPQTGFSFSGWVNFNNLSGAYVIFAALDFAGSAAYAELVHSGGGNLIGRMYGDSTHFIGRRSTSGPLGASAWHYVTMTWSGGTATTSIKIYVDGSQVDAADSTLGSVGFSAVSASTSFDWVLGAFEDGVGTNTYHADTNMPGGLDDIRFYNLPLTGTDIGNIRTAGLAGSR